MRRINYKINLSMSIILLLILVIGIGYAYLTSNLSISGTTEIAGNSWDIHFENLNVKDGSVTATTPATISNSTTDITYSIKLERPKDYYEFTVDVKNDGTLPGKVSISTLNGITTDAEPIIDYTIAYTNGNPVTIGDILNAGSKKTIKVRVFYKDEIDPDDFPDSDLTLTLTYTLQYIQSEEDEVSTDTIIEDLINNNSTCFIKYEGQVTDKVGETVTATKVYFNKCDDKRNIIFNNMCWQMIRTTETGGVKILYNGEPDQNGECGNSRDDHTGMAGAISTTQTLSSEYLYGNSVNYDKNTAEFTLVDTVTGTWSDTTYQNLLGKFTCKNLTGICTDLYHVGGYSSNTSAYVSGYTMGSINYSLIGKSPFSSSNGILSSAGYMFNKEYKSYTHSDSNTYQYGSSFIYDDTANTYQLSGTLYTGNIMNKTILDTHYTCWNGTGICNSISFVYSKYSLHGHLRYLNLMEGDSVDDAISQMLFDDDVNKYNTPIKSVIESWYSQSMLNKASEIEDVVYCNDRSISDYAGWDPNEGKPGNDLIFTEYKTDSDISCHNNTDQFAVNNDKAQLLFPVGLLSEEERYNINNTSLLSNNTNWWTITPDSSTSYAAGQPPSTVNIVDTDGSSYSRGANQNLGVRPVISLVSGIVISSGTGSTTDPWVIEE